MQDKRDWTWINAEEKGKKREDGETEKNEIYRKARRGHRDYREKGRKA